MCCCKYSAGNNLPSAVATLYILLVKFSYTPPKMTGLRNIVNHFYGESEDEASPSSPQYSPISHSDLSDRDTSDDSSESEDNEESDSSDSDETDSDNE